MNDKQTKGKRNLTILSWMGLVCQAFGVLFAFGSMFGLVGSADDAWKRDHQRNGVRRIRDGSVRLGWQLVADY